MTTSGAVRGGDNTDDVVNPLSVSPLVRGSGGGKKRFEDLGGEGGRAEVDDVFGHLG